MPVISTIQSLSDTHVAGEIKEVFPREIMTIVALCLGTCFIAMNYKNPEMHGIITNFNVLDYDLDRSILRLKMLQNAVNLHYEKDLFVLLNENLADVVNPTLEAVRRNVNGSQENGDNPESCYETTKQSMVHLTKDNFDNTFVPCLDQFKTFIRNSLKGVPELTIALEQMRTRIDDVIPTCNKLEAENKVVLCAKGQYAQILNESKALMDAEEGFTNAERFLFILANSEFKECMEAAGIKLESEVKKLREDGIKCKSS